RKTTAACCTPARAYAPSRSTTDCTPSARTASLISNRIEISIVLQARPAASARRLSSATEAASSAGGFEDMACQPAPSAVTPARGVRKALELRHRGRELGGRLRGHGVPAVTERDHAAQRRR